LRRLPGLDLDVVTFAYFVALNDPVGFDFLARLSVDLLIFDTVSGISVDLMEADLLALGCCRKQRHGARHE
jgi:hypothetical protein